MTKEILIMFIFVNWSFINNDGREQLLFNQ